MLATLMYGPGDVRCEQVDDPRILKPTDAIIKLSATCICGSDLWPYRGLQPIDGKRVFYRTGYARGWPRRRVTPGPSSVIGTAWLT
ncbi:hypothetical protein ACVIQT_008373 [Bradyrhizobium diazoefficiens]